MSWGFPLPDVVRKQCGEPVRCWGARAIYTSDAGGGRCELSLLPDRMYAEGCAGTDDALAFTRWITGVALPGLRRWCEGQKVHGSSLEVFSLHDSGCTCMASCNASYGYMYIGCWEYPVTADDVWRDVFREWHSTRGGMAMWNGASLAQVAG